MFFSGKRPTDLGVKNGKLNACPDSPNCVSSQAEAASQKIDPFIFKEPESDMQLLKKILEHREDMKIIESKKDYLYVESKTPMMGFVDDLEFYYDADEKVCHVRSASRLGHSDFGKNRSRIEEIRSKFISAIDQ